MNEHRRFVPARQAGQGTDTMGLYRARPFFFVVIPVIKPPFYDLAVR